MISEIARPMRLNRGASNYFALLISLVLCQSLNAQTVMKFKKHGELIAIPVVVNGLEVDMVLDTGAALISIPSRAGAFMLEYGYLTVDDVLGTASISDAYGGIKEETVVRLRKVEIGGVVLTDIKGTVREGLRPDMLSIDTKFALTPTVDRKDLFLLGQSTLKKLGRFEIDYVTGTFTIHPPSAAGVGKKAGEAGIRKMQD
jgi:hypothetical protein